MELTPQDLGSERYLTLMRRRLMPLTSQNANTSTTIDDEGRTARGRRIRGRRLRRYWVKDLPLDEETGEQLGNALWHSAQGLSARVVGSMLSVYLLIPSLLFAISGNFFAGFGFFAIWCLVMWGIFQSPRPVVRRLHRKHVTTTEIESLLPTARGRLERTYLNLVNDTLRQNIPSPSAQADIRAALRDLGDAIARLPADSVPSADPTFLRGEAQRLRTEAGAEADEFIRASLLRQAEASERRASLGDHNAHSSRRAAALRREAKAQMDALRAVVLAFDRTSATDAAGVARLAESVSRVAQEAQAVTVARRELEEGEIAVLMGQPIPLARKVVPVPSVPAEQAPQVVQTRNWWRNQS